MLYEKLRAYSQSAVPFHMPGHKRNTRLAPYLDALGAQMDITEIDGFDDLHDAEGVLYESMQRASRLWGSDKTRYLVNGSTVGILSAIYALSGNGGRAVIARNCHKSVYHALEITGVRPVFMLPEFDEQTGMFLSLDPGEIEGALQKTDDVRFVMLTSPTYEGVISDIKSICEIAHKRGVPVIVDEAHGAHLSLSESFPGGAVRAGADIVIHSVHKTLPSLTQTAVMHISGALADINKLDHALDIFETSSPSYLLMASIDGCVRFMEEEGVNVQEALHDALSRFYERARTLQNIRILRPENAFLFDDTKILISGAGLSGKEIMKLLRDKYSIELEAACPAYAIAMTGTGTTEAHLDKLYFALRDMDAACTAEKAMPSFLKPVCPECVISEKEALACPFELIPCAKAAGRISAEYAWAYPPGIPVIAPGEKIDNEAVEHWEQLLNAGLKTVSTRSRAGFFAVISEKFMKVPEK